MSRTETSLVKSIAKLPSDPSIFPTRTFYVRLCGSPTKTVEVFDMTKRTTTCWDTEEFNAEVRELVWSSYLEPYLTVKWPKLRTADVFQEARGGLVATMEAPLLPSGTTRLTFPAEPPRPPQKLRVSPVRLVDANEWFIRDNIVYVWEKIPRHLGRGYSLYSYLWGRKRQVGRYFQDNKYKTGGTLLLDTELVNEMVGVLTCLAVLAKHR